ncbi:MAG: Nif3-like dinuclear metal center hexameric protein [Bacillota bacterium]
MVPHETVLGILEELAPRLCAEPGDEPRFEIRHGEACRRLGVCTEPTERNILLAAGQGADFLLTHHAWEGEGAEVIAAKKISLYRLHSAWDLAPEGNLVTLARMLGLRELVLREGTITGTTDLALKDLLDRAQRLAGRNVLPYCGDPNRRVRTVGIIPGSGFLPVFRRRWEALAALGCDTIISGEISHAAARFAARNGVRLVDLGHSGLVRPGMMHLAYLLRCRLMAYGCEVDFYEDAYSVEYHSAASSRTEEGKSAGEPPGGVVLPFPR